MKTGDKVKMTRRPFFRGTIIAEPRQRVFGFIGRSYHIQWSFKPKGWVSPIAIRECDLKPYVKPSLWEKGVRQLTQYTSQH